MPGMSERCSRFIDWVTDTMIIVVPIIGTAIVLSIFGLAIAQGVKSVAQTRTTDAQLMQAVADLAAIEVAYEAAKDYGLSDRGTVTAAQEARQAMSRLGATLAGKTPPLHMLAIHEQLRFAAGRCENFTSMAATGGEQRGNPIALNVLVSLREYCAVQVNEARRMIAEAGMERGINPFR